MILDVSPAKIPRIIGRRGSMINMIQDHLKIDTMVGQNGRIWISAPSTEVLRLAIKAFKTIEDQAHTSKLTDRISEMLKEEMAAIKGSSEPEEEDSPEKASVPDESSEVEADTPDEVKAEPEPESEPEPEVVTEAEEEKPAEVEAEAEVKEEDETQTEEVSEE
jgi:exosome complex component RRP4